MMDYHWPSQSPILSSYWLAQLEFMKKTSKELPKA
jgi:hypothetical protein